MEKPKGFCVKQGTFFKMPKKMHLKGLDYSLTTNKGYVYHQK